ncbi:MAG TPA: hypothetical protein VKA84_13150 [Gemmatimonadaceae bacterium]|nr:hypothetical protein [Gemmatimonadaceae bacterium]
MRLRSGHAVAAMLVMLVMLASAACRRGEIVSGVSDSAFIRAMVDLRRIQNNPSLDSTRRKMARDSVLQGRGLTPAELERAARALADDPERAGNIWREIEGRMHVPTETTPPPTPAPAPAAKS